MVQGVEEHVSQSGSVCKVHGVIDSMTPIKKFMTI
jgi:hypothetical protein